MAGLRSNAAAAEDDTQPPWEYKYWGTLASQGGGTLVKTEATFTHEAGTPTNRGGDPSTTEEGPGGHL